jgi:hypothetical protein
MVTMEDTIPEILESVIDWMYSGALVLPKLRHDSDTGSKSPSCIAKADTISEQSSPDDPNPDPFTNGTKQEDTSTDSVKDSIEVSPTPDIDDDVDREYQTLLDVYIFATTYDLRLLRLEVMKKWQEIDTKSFQVCGNQIVKRAYKYLPENSLLLVAIGHAYVSRWKYITTPEYKSNFPEALKRYPSVFGAHLANFLINQPVDSKGLRIDYNSESCKLHEHPNTEEKKLCRLLRKEENLAPKRKHAAEVELPVLAERIATHRELWAQWETSNKRKKIEKDADNLIIKIKN